VLDESNATRAVAALRARFGDAARGRDFEVSLERGDAVSGSAALDPNVNRKMVDTITEAMKAQPAFAFMAEAETTEAGSTPARKRAGKVEIIKDLRHADGQGWQVGCLNGWYMTREFARTIVDFDPEACRVTYADGPATPDPWCYQISGFTMRPDWPLTPGDVDNCAHVLRSDGTTQPVRIYGNKLFVTPEGTENWTH
jgi:hypothetical protein